MAANTILFLHRLWLVDGFQSGIQWGWRYKDTDKDQPRFLLAHPDTFIIFSSDHAGLATLWCVLGRLYFRNFCWIIYPLVVFARGMEICTGLKVSVLCHITSTSVLVFLV